MEDINIINTEELENIAGGVIAAGEKKVEIVNCKTSVNVRSTPFAVNDTNKVGSAKLGEQFPFLGWSGSWARVKYNGKTAYIHKDYIKVIA